MRRIGDVLRVVKYWAPEEVQGSEPQPCREVLDNASHRIEHINLEHEWFSKIRMF